MDRTGYVKFMETSGFPHDQAEKMADFALMDFDSYEEAWGYYFHSPKFWRMMVYAGHRKARRLFRKKEPASRNRQVAAPLSLSSYAANATNYRNKTVKKRPCPSANTISPPKSKPRLKRLS